MTTTIRIVSPPAGAICGVGANLVAVECGVCGTLHAIPEAWQRTAQREGGHHWYCPRGHQIGYGRSENDHLRERLAAEQARAIAERDLREDTERRLRAQKAATTKARKRHAAGLCPCCKRSFQQLARHMATKHPDYDPAKAG